MNTHARAYSGRVIFDHLQKTAGQAVNAWLRGSLGNGCVTTNLMGRHRRLIAQYGGNFSVISGHVLFDGEGFDPRYDYIINTDSNPLNRSYHWLKLDQITFVHEGMRTALPQARLKAGQQLSMTMKIKSPEVAGEYILSVLPVQEGYSWFDELGFTPGEIQVQVRDSV